jgi:ribose 5-phosphate isomerase B
MKIALSTDHAGFESLATLQTLLEGKGHECVNYGPKSFDANDDYPDFIFPAAKAVADGSCERGIIMGGSGQGEAMAANRIKSVRCGVFYGPVTPRSAINAKGEASDDPYAIVKLMREHNDTNMLSLGARFLSQDEIEKAVQLWLETPTSSEERHQRRIAKLDT